jgi:hypothetical protein
MLNNISQRIIEVNEKRGWKIKLEKDLVDVERKLAQEKTQFQVLEKRFTKEKLDVEKLEKLSLRAVFATILGSRDEQMDKERQEMLTVQMQYQQARKMVDSLVADQAYLKQQLSALKSLDAEYAQLLTNKEELIKSGDSVVARELVPLSEKIGAANLTIKELDEAIRAGQQVLAGLDEVNDALSKAENWGTWDMLGGGMLSTMIKHDHMDTAKDAANQVQLDMQRFQRELADVQREIAIDVELSGSERFLDFFMDGLMMDWIVQAHINNSQEQARQAHLKVRDLVQDLQKRKRITAQDLDLLQQKRVRILSQEN